MSGEARPAKPSGSLLGKEFILVLVIIFSGASFTLGYFVGKNTGDERSVDVAELQKRCLQFATPPVETTQAAPAENAQASAGDGAVQAPLNQPVPQTASQGQRSVETAQAASDTDDRTEEKSGKYTVQIGAFKSPSEARQMKAKFEKKGYKPYISPATDSKGTRIYKVKTGAFGERKEAEVLALRLKKSEGLHAYVTTASE